MNAMHSLLRRQWKRHFGPAAEIPPEWRDFLVSVDAAYREADQDRAMLERSLELNSQELLQANTDLRAMFQAFPDLLFRITPSGEILDFKAGLTDDLALRPQDVVGKRIQDVIVPSEPGDPLGSAIRRAGQWRSVAHAEYAVKRGGEDWYCEARVVALPGDQLIVIIRNIDERRRAERLRGGQNQLFEMIASGGALHEQLDRLARLLGEQLAGGRVVVLLADPAGRRLEVGAAPMMPPDFANAVPGGIPIADGAGSCGTAAFRKSLVIVPDVETDPLWAGLQDYARRFEIAACCSAPIISHQDAVVGTLALYFNAPHQPTPDELHLISLGAHIAGVAIQRKRAEEELFNSRQMLRMVLDTIPQRVFWKDTNCIYVGCNKPLAQDCGFDDPAALVGKSDFDTDSAEIAEIYRADDFNVMRTDRPKLNYEEPQVTASGEKRWLRTSKVPLHDKDGHVIGVLGTYEDITEHKHAEEALHRAEAKYRNIVENAVEGLFQSTPAGQFIEANPAFARMLGYATPAELMAAAENLRLEFWVDRERHDEFVRLLTARGIVQRFETRMRRYDGRVAWISLNVRLVRADDGSPQLYEGFAEDITERKQLEEQFRQSQKMEAFGQLAGGIAHDFNNILTVIRVSAAMLQDEGLDAAEREVAIAETLRAADRATNLTRQLLTFSRRQPLQTQTLDLNEIVAGMTQMFQRLIGEHITLETHYATGGALVRADAGMMEQALMNLAVNSRDAMPKGGRLVLRTTIESISEDRIAARSNAHPGEYVRLSVSDTGIGIAPEHLPHIFEPFFTTKDVGRGTGLGLATVFGIVNQHGGWIEVESRPAEGATFHLFFPRLARTGVTQADKRATRPPPRGSETILLAEDESDVRALMKAALERHGYQVLVATSGVNALQVWQQRGSEVDLLVTDMVMPEGIGGRELAERLRAEKPALKVIYCSGYTDEVLGRDSPLRDNLNFIEKPFDIGLLLRRVRDCLDA